MDIGGTIDKVLTPIEKYATYLGLGAELFTPNVLNVWQDNFDQLMHGHLHMTDIQPMLADIQNTPRFRTYLIAAFGGYILKDATNNRTITKVATIAQKVGTAALALFLAAEIMHFSTHSPGPSGNASGSYTGAKLIGN